MTFAKPINANLVTVQVTAGPSPITVDARVNVTSTTGFTVIGNFPAGSWFDYFVIALA